MPRGDYFACWGTYVGAYVPGGWYFLFRGTFGEDFVPERDFVACRGINLGVYVPDRWYFPFMGASEAYFVPGRIEKGEILENEAVFWDVCVYYKKARYGICFAGVIIGQIIL